MSEYNILFYSNLSETGQALITLMQNENLLRFFHLVCTDNNPNVSPHISKTLPTLIIRGLPTPYVGTDAFSWLARVKQWKHQVMLKKVATEQQQYIQAVNRNLQIDNEQMLGFSKAEMQGMSDMFAFFSSDMRSDIDSAFPQSYVQYDSLGEQEIITLPDEKNIGRRKIDESQHKKLFAEIDAERKRQDKMFEESIGNFRKQFK